jgi:hypothetical protein
MGLSELRTQTRAGTCLDRCWQSSGLRTTFLPSVQTRGHIREALQRVWQSSYKSLKLGGEGPLQTLAGIKVHGCDEHLANNKMKARVKRCFGAVDWLLVLQHVAQA